MTAATATEATKRTARRRRRISRGDTIRIAALTVVAIPWILVPLWVLVVNSFKPLNEASLLGLGLPHEWAFVENYTKVIQEGNYGPALINSLVIAIPTIVTVVFLGSMAAWAFTRSRNRVMKVAYSLTVLSILLPPAILPTIYEMQLLGLDGSRLGYYLVMVGTRLGTIVFLAAGFIRALPADLEEAAEIDGATKLQTYWHVILPLLVPVLLVGSVILIITIWNEFFFASFLLQGADSATLPLALFQFASASSEQAVLNWNLIFAHVILTSLPLLIVYLFVQGRIVTGLSEGAIKA